MTSWRIALAPRPRFTTHGRHWWRELVTSNYRAAADARAALRESARDAGGQLPGTAGAAVAYHQLSDDEFEQLVPTPRLADFMRELSQGAREPLW